MVEAMLAAITIAAAQPAVSEKNPFHFPQASDVRMQTIERQPNEAGWPFSVDRGLILCVYSVGQPLVMFSTLPEDEDSAEDFEPRMVIVSTNPFDLAFANLPHRDLFRPKDNIEDLIRAVAPFQALGKRLCEQPRGQILGSGEL